VTTLTITAEPKNWQNAIRVAVHEVCSFAGLCNSAIFNFLSIDCFSLFIVQLLVFLLSLTLKYI
jgi:hypothetical protein